MKESIPIVHFSAENKLGFDIVQVSSILKKSFQRHRSTETHRIGFCGLFFVEIGSGSHEVDFEDYPVRSGDLVVIARGRTHRFQKKKGFDGRLLLFTEEFLYRGVSLSSAILLNLLYPINPLAPVVTTDDRARRALATLFDEWEANDPFEREGILRSLLDNLLLHVSRLRHTQISHLDGGHTVHLFSGFFRLLQEHHRETRNATDYAAMLGVSYKHLNAICKQACDMTAKQAIDDYLIMEMKRVLATANEDSIEELAVFFGFDEPTNLVKYFKRHTGRTPAMFRRERR